MQCEAEDPYADCGGVASGCNPCRKAVASGQSCGTVCAATPLRLTKSKCGFCSGPLNPLVSPGGYCPGCVAGATRALA